VFLLAGFTMVARFLAGRIVVRFVVVAVDEQPPSRGRDGRGLIGPADREDEPPLSVSRERARIAQDVHGIVRTEIERLTDDPDRSSRVTAELDRLVDLLGGDLAPAGDPPGVTDVPDLIAEAAPHGADLRLVLRNGVRAVPDASGLGLPVDVSLAIYRVLEDAIDNVVDHAAPCGGTVTIHRLEDHVEVEVLDDGEPLANPVRGHGGLLAIRERATAHGGTLYAARRDAGGVRIRVRLPLPQEDPVADEAPDPTDDGPDRSDDPDQPDDGPVEPEDAEILTDPASSTTTTAPSAS
ncbi:MAG: sensor histidine kinase, partial [Solirubrobacteraceae bacterium]